MSYYDDYVADGLCCECCGEFLGVERPVDDKLIRAIDRVRTMLHEHDGGRRDCVHCRIFDHINAAFGEAVGEPIAAMKPLADEGLVERATLWLYAREGGVALDLLPEAYQEHWRKQGREIVNLLFSATMHGSDSGAVASPPVDKLREALEWQSMNFALLLAGKPVRDVDEMNAAVRAALNTETK